MLCSMLNNRSVSSLIPSWDTCIEMLFKSHLPKKFAFTGRLSENDITKNGFYATRRSKSPCVNSHYCNCIIYQNSLLLLFILLNFD